MRDSQHKAGILSRIAGLGWMGAALTALGAAANQILDVLLLIAG